MSKIVKARFYIAEVTCQAYGANTTPYGKVVLRASTSGDNKQWAASTPVGEFTMTIHSEAMTVFNAALGKDVEITITVPDDEPTEARPTFE